MSKPPDFHFKWRPDYWTLLELYLPEEKCTQREYDEASRKARYDEWAFWDQEQGAIFGVATFCWDDYKESISIEPRSCETCRCEDDFDFRWNSRYNHRSCTSCRAVIITQIKKRLKCFLRSDLIDLIFKFLDPPIQFYVQHWS